MIQSNTCVLCTVFCMCQYCRSKLQFNPSVCEVTTEPLLCLVCTIQTMCEEDYSMRVKYPSQRMVEYMYVMVGCINQVMVGQNWLIPPSPTNSGRLLNIHAQGLTHWLLFFIERLAYKNYVHCTVQNWKNQGREEKMTTVSIFVICAKKFQQILMWIWGCVYQDVMKENATCRLWFLTLFMNSY